MSLAFFPLFAFTQVVYLFPGLHTLVLTYTQKKANCAIMLLNTFISLTTQRQAICAAYLADETELINRLAQDAALSREQQQRVHAMTHAAIAAVRETPRTGLDALLAEYDLSNQEGVALMCLAEALLRIPDTQTVDRLIRDKLAHADWDRHLGKSDSLFVNASTWGLLLTGKIIRLDKDTTAGIGNLLSRMVARSGEPAIRMAIKSAMRIIGQQFVMAETVVKAWENARNNFPALLLSIDMLGEAALTQAAAENYFAAYAEALQFIGRQHAKATPIIRAPGVSVKLSALHPRFELAKRDRLNQELVPKLRQLCQIAKSHNLQLTLDAEEARRLDPLLDVFSQVFTDPALQDWEGLGLAVQAYQKRAPQVIDHLTDLARHYNKRINVRLVKGAYWDSEIKWAQQQGLSDYPVFTRKIHTDVCYLACVKKLFGAGTYLYPQFATHNAETLATILELAGPTRDFECQRLHGMGEALYEHVMRHTPGLQCRIYAPVGNHAELLPYLVRRLLENGANTSFVNRLSAADTPIDKLIVDPVAQTQRDGGRRHRHIPSPAQLFAPERINAMGVHLDNPAALNLLKTQMDAYQRTSWHAGPSLAQADTTATVTITNPADHSDIVGHLSQTLATSIGTALDTAYRAFPDWSHTSAAYRAGLLTNMASLLEQHLPELLTLLVREAGRCVSDAIAEVREGVDFCRYYAALAQQQFATPRRLPGPTGEANSLGLAGRGLVLCISPWNFPLSIFLGQVSAALAAGNCVVAKPASATPLVAARVIELLYVAGIPRHVVQLITGGGEVLSHALLGYPHLSGVLFTGSTATAKSIQRQLAQRDGPIIPLLAETGGINCMIVDSSALPEQVVTDVIQSAFNSAGQRCSALRLLYLQQDIADTILAMLCGAMEELAIGNPALLVSDVGPVINADARDGLLQYMQQIDSQATLVHRLQLDKQHSSGYFVAPCVYELQHATQLSREVFGPVLHVVRYRADKLTHVVNEINASGYGLTLGIHSRIQNTIDAICQGARVGNIYVNRNMIGAVVGVQPFGGEGLSGTGPKAGGPHYLTRLGSERVISNNISAIGGNTDLLSLLDD
jgi:RHH-type proline utilization regulon transcriptional repressor/proline dehydrogenase/delta 1-pyrroline-5-carboxylate dehydrogenase